MGEPQGCSAQGMAPHSPFELSIPSMSSDLGGEDDVVSVQLSQPVAATAFLESGPSGMAMWASQSQKMLVNDR